MEDLDRAGGIPAVMRELSPLLHLDALTVTGYNVARNIASARVLDREVIRSIRNPVTKEGGIAILKGTLAPRGAVVKVAAVSPEMRYHEGPARVFDSEEEAMKAILGGRIQPGDVVVIRYEGQGWSGNEGNARSYGSHRRHGAFGVGCAYHRWQVFGRD